MHSKLPKPTLYSLSEFHPWSVKYAQSLFDCILHTDPAAKDWRSKANTILVKDYPITGEDLLAPPLLRAISKQAVGTENIDTESCAELGVKVFNTLGVNASAVAEMALARTLSSARDIPGLRYRQHALRQSIRNETCNGILLTGSTVGIIGLGNIGEAVANMSIRAFASNTVAYDPFMPDDVWADILHHRVTTLDEVLTGADVVTLHVYLTKQTAGLISYPKLQRMKRTAILINAARGGIVDEDDLHGALDENLIRRCGLDCHVQEPPTFDKYQTLWAHDHYVDTPPRACCDGCNPDGYSQCRD
ncbi:hypothetical protein LTR84_008803 [Exophiala bonariae]|uniref:D-isomer specific 2-hydroxyacid dehydrogenase NAD-binding domain-containing protein n=1 Tax=Exophiala bonariae TaxID=1690606 RepID=A0AAV9MWI0_9EURO|nr:hypothetical protein LTR84_008803 [Exophiala bonariae]